MPSFVIKQKKKYIIYFYQNYLYAYKAIAYDDNLNILKDDNIYEDGQDENYFFKCVHFIEEVGVFGFFNPEDNLFTFKFKLFNNDKQFEDYYSQELISLNLLEINENKMHNVENNDLIKLNDKKICFTNSDIELEYLHLFIIYDYLNEKIKIRYYQINLNLYLLEFQNKLSLTLYNNFICLSSSYSQIRSWHEEEIIDDSSSLIIFSYPNSKDFEVDITNNLKQYQNITIDLNSKCIIDNNIFGLIPKEIKLINFADVFELYSSKDYRKLDIGDSINTDENITLFLSKNISINIPKVGKINYAMIITEPDYDIYNNYATDNINCFGEDDENNGNFIKNDYIGRHSYCSIKINENKIKNQCVDNNCELCLVEDENKCVFCKNKDIILENGEISCVNNEKISTTIIETTLPTTTIPESTILKTTMPETTIPKTTIPETTLPETTIPKTTIPDTTIPDTTYFKLPETTIIETSILGTTYIEKDIIDTTILEESIIGTTIPYTTILTNIKTSYISQETFPKLNIIETSIPDTTIITKIETTNIKVEKTEFNYIDKLNCTKDEIINNKCNKGKVALNQIKEIKNDLLKLSNNNNTILIQTDNMNIQIATEEEEKKIFLMFQILI